MEQLIAIDPVFYNKEKNAVRNNIGDYLFKMDSEYNDLRKVEQIDVFEEATEEEEEEVIRGTVKPFPLDTKI